jgi:hypothetical protein
MGRDFNRSDVRGKAQLVPHFESAARTRLTNVKSIVFHVVTLKPALGIALQDWA